MTFDLIGSQPRKRSGASFCLNNHAWSIIGGYCDWVAPDITLVFENWYMNSGEEINEATSIALASRLREEIASGRAEEILTRRENAIRANDGKSSLRRGWLFAQLKKFIVFLDNCGGFQIH